MNAPDSKVLMAFIAENQSWHGKPLHAAILEKLLSLGVSGATVLRGVEGYGSHHKIHTANVLFLSEQLPLVVLAADTTPQIEAAVEALRQMGFPGILLLSPCEVIRLGLEPAGDSKT
jgi:PII-like signaling protein